ncbi:helix-turn-helix transcriptional regulator [Candidatus Oleimmundimicrobium sp.]|uniref:helix-turn-helix domain-containing protein n=1 Tax=Candidatus Oleimmundimicrobium sp. TaxID=3060597 RepID=UPI00280C34DF|nr:helix-turn-helix transcriptional regulator [Candidatus Oleimmundimicrobium sp.]
MWIETNKEALKEFRIREGYSQRQFATKAGISSTMLSQIESGQRNPSPKTAKKIIDVLGVSFSAVFKLVSEDNFFAHSTCKSSNSDCKSV